MSIQARSAYVAVVTIWMAEMALAVAFCADRRQPKQDRQPTKAEVIVRQFLQAYLHTASGASDKTTRYQAAFVDLNGDGIPEAIVYFTGGAWCGSGGCTTLVLTRSGSSYRVISKIPITRPPIRVLKTVSNGWRGLSVWVQGGGIQPGYEAELRFNGKSYPANPSIPPARRPIERAAGEVVVSASMQGVPLYP
jgi:putative lipoprotein